MSDIEQCINEAGKGPFGFGLGAPRAKASLISMLLLLVPLAGCAGSDGEVNVDLTTEEIQELIDDNIDDFLNNTTITVNQDADYHNNTTVVNHFSNNSTTNLDQSGASSSTTTYYYNGSDASDIRMFTVQWNPLDHVEDPTHMQLVRPICREYDYEEPAECNQDWDYGWDSILGEDDALIDDYNISTIYVYQYNGQTVEITATCMEWYQYYEWGQNEWRDYLANNYGYNSNQIESAASDLSNVFDYGPWGIDSISFCFNGGQSDWATLFEIDLEQGTAMEFLSVPELAIDINCEDGFGTGIGNHSGSHLMGGQANCTVSGSTRVYYDMDHYSYWQYDEDNNTDWQEIWIEMNDVEAIVPLSFAVYFELHPVTVHQ